jgi:hypothetical protein
MLKTVVEYYGIRAVLLDGPAGGGPAIRLLQTYRLGKATGDQTQLVRQLPRLGAVTAGKDGHLPTSVQQTTCYIDDQGRLARSAGGDVAHADDGDFDRYHTGVLVEAPIPQRDAQSVHCAASP